MSGDALGAVSCQRIGRGSGVLGSRGESTWPAAVWAGAVGFTDTGIGSGSRGGRVATGRTGTAKLLTPPWLGQQTTRSEWKCRFRQRRRSGRDCLEINCWFVPFQRWHVWCLVLVSMRRRRMGAVEIVFVVCMPVILATGRVACERERRMLLRAGDQAWLWKRRWKLPRMK